MTVMSGAQSIVKCLEQLGVEYAFGICGHGNLPLLDALADSSIKFISVHHEQVAVHAADAYFRFAHRPAAVITTVGPGASNTITGLLDAALDSSALIMIAGGVPSAYAGRDPLQEISLHHDDEQADIFKPAVKRVLRPGQASALPNLVAKAFNFATSGCPGPVMLHVPLDFLCEREDFSVDEDVNRRAAGSRPRSTQDAVTQAIDLLLSAERPLIYAGGGVLLSEASEELTRFAEALEIPVATTMSGQGAIPEDHDLAVGFTGTVGTPIGNAASHEADVILAIGTRFPEMDSSSWRSEFFFQIPPARLIHVDINPYEIGKIYPTALGIVGDARVVLKDLQEAVQARGGKPRRTASWTQDLQRRRDEWNSRSQELRNTDTSPMEPASLLTTARNVLPRDGILISGVGVRHAVGQHFPIYGPQTHAVASGFGTMGWEVPAAIGAKLACPDKPVLALVGDGAFLSTISTIPTAVEYGINATWVVLNNHGYASIAVYQAKHYGRYMSAYFERGDQAQPYDPDYQALGRAFGAQTARVTNPSELAAALSSALQSDQPSVIDALVTHEPRILASGHWDVNNILAGTRG